jgi:uncharacterized protein YbaR (Trm112 family)
MTENFKYFSLEEVGHGTIQDRVLPCPKCGHEHIQLDSKSIEDLEKDIRQGLDSGRDYVEAARRSQTLDGKHWYNRCHNCRYIFEPSEYRSDKWSVKDIQTLICPSCRVATPKTVHNKDTQGYHCTKCGQILEYTAKPHECDNDNDLRVDAIGGYIKTYCENCGHRNMQVQETIVVTKEKLIIPLTCPQCKRRESLKLVAPFMKTFEIIYEEQNGSAGCTMESGRTDGVAEETFSPPSDLEGKPSNPVRVRKVAKVAEQPVGDDGKEGSNDIGDGGEQHVNIEERINRLREEAYILRAKDRQVKDGSLRGPGLDEGSEGTG